MPTIITCTINRHDVFACTLLHRQLFNYNSAGIYFGQIDYQCNYYTATFP